jgi:hypothetical protein
MRREAHVRFLGEASREGGPYPTRLHRTSLRLMRLTTPSGSQVPVEITDQESPRPLFVLVRERRA